MPLDALINLVNVENLSDEEFVRYAPRGINTWLDNAIERLRTNLDTPRTIDHSEGQ